VVIVGSPQKFIIREPVTQLLQGFAANFTKRLGLGFEFRAIRVIRGRKNTGLSSCLGIILALRAGRFHRKLNTALAPRQERGAIAR
jgi:hypothetical protein